MRYGTSHFVSHGSALAYYRSQGNDYTLDDLEQDLRSGAVTIGRPPLPKGAKLLVIPGEGRYAIEEGKVQ
jgi:hypothetical protein